MADADEVVTLARAEGPRGEIVLRRRVGVDGGDVHELIVNGTFAMDSMQTSTELTLARLGGRPGAVVLVGGLGLGYTTAELLRLGVGRVDVVELEECIVNWARDGLTPTLASIAADPRVRVQVGDIVDVLLASRSLTSAGSPADYDTSARMSVEAGVSDESHGPSGQGGPDGVPSAPDDGPAASADWDAILLDVDNGPDFLIHAGNARLYEADLLRAAVARLRPGGTLAVWCQGPTPALATTLARLGGRVEELLLDVARGGRRLTYAIYTVTR